MVENTLKWLIAKISSAENDIAHLQEIINSSGTVGKLGLLKSYNIRLAMRKSMVEHYRKRVLELGSGNILTVRYKYFMKPHNKCYELTLTNISEDDARALLEIKYAKGQIEILEIKNQITQLREVRL